VDFSCWYSCPEYRSSLPFAAQALGMTDWQTVAVVKFRVILLGLELAVMCRSLPTPRLKSSQARLRKMSDEELRNFGKAARQMVSQQILANLRCQLSAAVRRSPCGVALKTPTVLDSKKLATRPTTHD
jgi:hypothetical protein